MAQNVSVIKKKTCYKTISGQFYCLWFE